MKKESLFTLAIIILLPCALAARDFRDRLDDGCVAAFSVPDAWEIKAGPAKAWGKTYTVAQKGSRRFTLLMSVMKSGDAPPAPALVREQVEDLGRKALSGASEKRLDLREMTIARGAGFYYRLTAAEPRPEEYLYILQGQAARAKSIVSFTYLFNANNAGEQERVLAAVAGARVTCDDGPSAGLRGLLLRAGDLGDGCALGEELAGRSIRVQHYFLAPDAYAGKVPQPVAKEIQSLEKGGEKGSVMFFKFADSVEGRKAQFTDLFYGTDGGPTDDQPEEFIIHRDTMIVFCFERNSSLKKEAKRVILDRLK